MLLKFLKIWDKYSYLVAFALVVIIAAIITQGVYLQPENLLNVLKSSSIKGIIAIGMTLVILIGGIDLSVGSVLALAGGIGLYAVNASDNIFVGIIVMIAIGTIIGLINGLLITKAKIASFIVTLAMMSIARSLILNQSNGGNIPLLNRSNGFGQIANGYLNVAGFNISYQSFIFILVTLIAIFITTKMKIGRYWLAVGSNEKSSKLAGINTDRTQILAYTLCGLFVGISAILSASQMESITPANTGNGFELDAIAAVVIGGTRMSGGKGKIISTFFGMLIVTTIINMMTLAGITPYIQGVIKGLIIVAAVGLQTLVNILMEKKA